MCLVYYAHKYILTVDPQSLYYCYKGSMAAKALRTPDIDTKSSNLPFLFLESTPGYHIFDYSNVFPELWRTFPGHNRCLHE